MFFPELSLGRSWLESILVTMTKTWSLSTWNYSLRIDAMWSKQCNNHIFIISIFPGRTPDDKDSFYQGMVGEPGQESLVFASQRMLKVPRAKTDVIASDPTYKITPALLGALQVMILAFFAYGKVSTKQVYINFLSYRNIVLSTLNLFLHCNNGNPSFRRPSPWPSL